MSGFVHDSLADNPGDATLATGFDVGSEVDGLVGYYPFDGDATDGTELGNDGTVNGATFNGSGQVGGDSLSFDGTDDYVDVGDIHDSPLPGLTLATWVNPDDFNSHNHLISKTTGGLTSSTSSYKLRIQESSGDLETRIYNTNGDSEGVTAGTTSTGTWQHAAVTFDGGTILLYLNGSEVGSGSFSGDVQAGSEPLELGRRQDGISYLAGDMDDARIYERALSPPEIEALANRTETSPVPVGATL